MGTIFIGQLKQLYCLGHSPQRTASLWRQLFLGTIFVSQLQHSYRWSDSSNATAWRSTRLQRIVVSILVAEYLLRRNRDCDLKLHSASEADHRDDHRHQDYSRNSSRSGTASCHSYSMGQAKLLPGRAAANHDDHSFKDRIQDCQWPNKHRHIGGDRDSNCDCTEHEDNRRDSGRNGTRNDGHQVLNNPSWTSTNHCFHGHRPGHNSHAIFHNPSWTASDDCSNEDLARHNSHVCLYD